MNSALFARVGRLLLARAPGRFASRSCSRADSRAPTVRRTLGALLGLALLVSGCRGCSYHSHAEWHAGTGSSGGEVKEQPEEREGSTRSTGRRSPAGRDNVVRVSGDGNKSQGDQAGGGSASERGVVRPTGDVPPSSSGDSSQSARGESGQGGRSDSSSASGAASESGGKGGEPATPAAPAQPAEPAAQAPAEQAPDSGKPSLKSPSEPHITTPTQRKPRKVHRGGATNKEGRRE
jgi:hypothetical protein